MNTLFTTQNFLPDLGGIQAYMTGLADALAERGHRITVFCDSADRSAEVATDSVRNYSIRRYGGPRPWRGWRKAVNVSKYIIERDVRVIVADTWKSLERLPVGLLKNRRTVCLAHGAELLSTPRSAKGQRIARSFKKADIVGANSNFTADLVCRFVEDAFRVRVLWPGVHVPLGLDTQVQPKVQPSSSGPRLLTIARLDPYKGIDTVIRALPSLIPQHPGLLYEVVGAGRDRDRLLRLAHSLDILSSVRFHGAVAENAKAKLLGACDVFLLPNRSEPGEVEGFGIVLAEAGAFGKPCIAGRDGGTAAVILDGRTGFLVNGNDPLQVATSLNTLLEQPDLARRMGNAARERFRAEFVWDAAVKRFEAALYG
jgi:phosphatidylinositol alpha-1,6-mannosyltransferase